MELWNKNNPKQEMENALFYSIKEARPNFVVRPKKVGREETRTPEEFKGTVTVMNGYIQAFCKKIEASDFVPATDYDDAYSNVDAYTHCKGCTFKPVCRTMFSIGSRPLKEKSNGAVK